MRFYLAIDLKSFYASVECRERGLDPLTAHLVVADVRRTEKTICLAVSPALKSFGIPGRPRLFEVVAKVKEINAGRKRRAGGTFTGRAYHAGELADPGNALAYVVAPPRMALYLDYSKRIYSVYLRFVAPEDVHAYSVDEVFIDATDYLAVYRCTPRELAERIVRAVLAETGITATAGVGTNLYLAKVAMDVVAKKIPADEHGVRIAELDEETYRRTLWTHRPLTDFWRVGPAYREKLEAYGMYTMGDVARCSVKDEALLYRLFGINAELLIDHAWGWEPCTLAAIKAYRPQESSLSIGQVLSFPYSFVPAKLVVREMADRLSLELVEKDLVADQLVLTVGYDIDNLRIPGIADHYEGDVSSDRYGRKTPKAAHGSQNLGRFTSSTRLFTEAADALFDRIVKKGLLVRRMYVVANHVYARGSQPLKDRQLTLFDDAGEEELLEREHNVQEAVISIQKKFGKNALVKGMDLEEGATARERNEQIGGHKK